MRKSKEKWLGWSLLIKLKVQSGLIFGATILLCGNMFAGGIVTNLNQSASWVRLPCRNASVDIDAVYFNPAGLMKLENGFYVSLSNQTITQSGEVDNSYSGPGGVYGLNQHVFKGTVSAPVFPSIYAVYKMNKFAFSIGFNPIGGGGGDVFKKGLPSLEMSASDLVPLLAASEGASAYSLNAYFKGTSAFLGYQAGLSYKVSDLISIAFGLRYVSAKNIYEGHLTDIQVELPGGWERADAIMNGIAANATSASTGTTALITGGAGTLTLAQAQTFGIISAAQSAALQGALAAFGSPTTVTIAQADAVFRGAAAKYAATATLLGDQSANVSQTGSAVSPIFSVNISPSDKLNIAVKYEMLTKLNLQNNTTQDFLIGYTAQGVPITMFPNGAKTRNDIPAMLSLGVDYKFSSSLRLSLGSNYYFDKSADYGHTIATDPDLPPTPISNKEIIANNGLSFQGGLEYNISKKFLVSAGYIWSNKGVNSQFQSDLDYELATQTFGAGGAYLITDDIKVNVGVNYTAYQKDSKTLDHIFESPVPQDIQCTETYKKSALLFGIGVDFRF